MLSVLEKAACLPHYHTAQYKQRDHIRDRHQTVKDIRDGPYCFYGHVRSDEYCKDIQPAIGQNRFFMATGQVLQTTLTVVIPAEDRRKCKEHETDHQDKCRYLCRDRKTVLKCIGRDLHTLGLNAPFTTITTAAGISRILNRIRQMLNTK